MSTDLLRDLLRLHAFNSTPREAALGNLHVPFDAITGQPGCEQVLADSLRRGERVVLIGPSGSGKSSVTAHVLGDFVQDLAPIRVRIGLEPATVASDPAEFVRHLLRTLSKYLEQHKRAGGDRRLATNRAQGADSRGRGKRPVKVSVSAGVPWLQGELAVELGALVDTVGSSGQDVLEQAQRVLQLIAAWNLRPVLVLDDTDHWLVRPGLPEPAALIAGFFGRVVRLISEDLSDAAAVIAVHDTYLADQNYRDALPFLGSRVTMPAVPDPSGLGRILTYRAERVSESSSAIPVADLIEVEALDRLHANYAAGGRNLRATLQVVHSALTNACDASADVIRAGHIELAID